MKYKDKFLRTASSLFLYLLLISLGMMMTRCEESSDLELELAVNSNAITLKPEGGSTHIMVYSTGKWSVAFKEPVTWASIDKLEGEGNSSVVFSYSENLEASRKVTVLLTRDGAVQEVVLVQSGITPTFKLTPGSMVTSKTATPIRVALETTLKYTLDQVQIEVTYDDELSEEWITEAKLTHEGLEFYALENTTGSDRTASVGLVFVDGNGEEYRNAKVNVKQTTEGVYFTPLKDVLQTTKTASTEIVSFNTNIKNSSVFFGTTIQYTGNSSDWISNVVLKDSTLTFDIAENVSGSSRNASINLRLENKNGEIVNVNYPVVQSDKAETVLPFATLRAKITGASGEFSQFGDFEAIEAIVISDKDNPNMETNPQPTFNTIDFTESVKTAYVQSLDGTLGFRIKTALAEDNLFERYSKVTISLKGLTLEKEQDPERYTLKGVTEESILFVTNGTSSNLVNRSLFIDELSDKDIYTFVQLKNVEVALPYGSWTNVNWGYLTKNASLNPGGAPYVDAVPTSIRDNKGGHMTVLTNGNALWSRTSLPTGSGVLAGIVTHSKLKRFSTDATASRYSIRAVSEADIKLNDPAKASTLVEWHWMTSGACSAGVLTKDGNTIPARIGQGALTCTYPSAIASSGLGMHPVCNSNPLDNNTKGPSTAFTIGLAPNTIKWFDKSTGKGEGVIFKFSTLGVNGSNLTINFSQGGGSGNAATMIVPVDWKIEYSTDGVVYTTLPNSNYSVRPLTGWGIGFLFACPGVQDHSFTLPDHLFNKQDVWVRLVVASDACGSSTDMDGGENGLISASSGTTNINVRFGVISFKYNQ